MVNAAAKLTARGTPARPALDLGPVRKSPAGARARRPAGPWSVCPPACDRRRTSGQRRTRSAHAGLGTGRHACQRAAEHTTPLRLRPAPRRLRHHPVPRYPGPAARKLSREVLGSPPGPRRQHTRSGHLDLAILRTPPARRQHKGPDILLRRAYHDAMKASKDVILKKAALFARGVGCTSLQTRTQTWSCRISAANRCTPCPRIVEHRPSLKRNRQRCKGQTTSPSWIQPWPREPPACGQRSVRAIIVSPARKTARRRPRTSQVRPRPAGISSKRHTRTQSAMTPNTRAGNRGGKRRA